VAQVAAAAAPAILDKPVIEEAPELETSVATDAVVEPSFGMKETEPASRRPFLVILALCIVVGSAFAVGVWWKMKNAQLDGTVIHTEKMPVKPSSADSAQDSTMAAPSPAAAANATTSANPTTDNTSEASEPDTVPATPQELSKFPKVTGIRHWSSADSSTVVLDLQDQVQYEAHRLAGPDRIYFDLRDTQLNPDLIGKSIDIGDTFVSRVRMAQPVAGMTRIVLETRANSTFSVSLEPNPYRLVVEVRAGHVA